MNILCWNINKKDLSLEISRLCIERRIDILILCEHEELDIEHMLFRMRMDDYLMRGGYFDSSKRLIVFHREDVNCSIHTDGKRYVVHRISEKEGPEILLVSLHLSSQMHIDAIRQTHEISKVKAEIEGIEDKISNKLTLLVGDFNMNPFDRGMTDFFGLNSTMSLEEAQKLTRTVNGEALSYFYNPMWHYTGNNGMSLGTYYYRNSNVNIDWNTFDQLVMRPQLLEHYCVENISIVTGSDSALYISDKGIPLKDKYSDHLPLYFELRKV